MLDYYDSIGKQLVVSFGTSGEPTILEYFPTLLKFLHNRVREISVRTNLTAGLDWWKENGYLIHHVHGTVHYQNGISIKSLYDTVMQIAEKSQRFDLSVAMLPELFQQQLDDIQWLEEHSDVKVSILPLLKDLYYGGAWINYTEEQKLEIEKRYHFDSHVVSTHHTDTNVTIDVTSKTSFDVVFSENDNERCFLGWQCHAGIDTLVIDSRGYVRKGWCAQLAQDQKHMTEWAWNSDPFTCNMSWCRMHHDLYARKELNV